MNNINYYFEKCKCLASLAVFRILYDSQKDIYGIIAEFLKEIIFSKAKYNFNLTEITKMVNDNFDFNLPEAIVKASLKRITFIELSQGNYSIDNYSNENNTLQLWGV